jgi:hypothetical protein
MSEEGSGPVDGQEIKLDLVPHHQKHPAKHGGFLKTLLTGGAIIGGLVGVYFLWKHFFGKKKDEGKKNGRNQRFRKRETDETELEEELAAIYAEALADPEFVEFLETIFGAEFSDPEVAAADKAEE